MIPISDAFFPKKKPREQNPKQRAAAVKNGWYMRLMGVKSTIQNCPFLDKQEKREILMALKWATVDWKDKKL